MYLKTIFGGHEGGMFWDKLYIYIYSKDPTFVRMLKHDIFRLIDYVKIP